MTTLDRAVAVLGEHRDSETPGRCRCGFWMVTPTEDHVAAMLAAAGLLVPEPDADVRDLVGDALREWVYEVGHEDLPRTPGEVADVILALVEAHVRARLERVAAEVEALPPPPLSRVQVRLAQVRAERRAEWAAKSAADRLLIISQRAAEARFAHHEGDDS